MNALFVLEGRQVNTKLQRGFLADCDTPIRAEDALRGSQMLRDAILRAKGYPVPAPIAPVVVPLFQEREVKLGRRPGPQPKIRKTIRKITRIQGIIAEHFKITRADLKSDSRKRNFARPRQVAVFLARKTTNASLNDIAFHFGNRDHTTIIHAVSVVAKRAGNGDRETIAALHAAYSAGIR